MKKNDIKVVADESFTGKVYIFKVLEKEVSHVLPLNEVAKTIKGIIEEQKIQKKTQDKARNIYTQLTKEELTFEKAAKENNAQMFNTEYITRTDYLENVGPVNSLWDVVVSDGKKTFSEPFPMKNGFVLVKIEDFEPIDGVVYAKEKATFEQEALRKKQSTGLQTWFRNKKQRTEQKIDFQYI